jgi:hypothetical protein
LHEEILPFEQVFELLLDFGDSTFAELHCGGCSSGRVSLIVVGEDI